MNRDEINTNTVNLTYNELTFPLECFVKTKYSL